jgi:hypothetical protein
MKKLIFLLIGIFIFAFSCSNEILDTDSTLETVDLKYSNSKMVPIKGEVLVSIDEYDDQGLGIYGKMSGYFSHLGKFKEANSVWETVSHDLSQFPQAITFTQDAVFCAANGDLLHGLYTGTVDLTTLEVKGSFVIDGGTGRFENATGQTTADGYSWLDEYGRFGGMYLIGEGEISY